jgi:hypothetical protein
MENNYNEDALMKPNDEPVRILTVGRWRKKFYGTQEELDEYIAQLKKEFPLPMAQGRLVNYDLQYLEEYVKSGPEELSKLESALPEELLKYAHGEESPQIRNHKLLNDLLIKMLDFPYSIMESSFRNPSFFPAWMRFLYRMILITLEDDKSKADKYDEKSAEWCDMLSTVLDFLTEKNRRERLSVTIEQDGASTPNDPDRHWFHRCSQQLIFYSGVNENTMRLLQKAFTNQDQYRRIWWRFVWEELRHLMIKDLQNIRKSLEAGETLDTLGVTVLDYYSAIGKLRYWWTKDKEGQNVYNIFVELPKALNEIRLSDFIDDDRISFRTAAFLLLCSPAHFLAQELGNGYQLMGDGVKYLFRKRGQKWVIRFGWGREKEVFVKDYAGMDYIQFLVKEKGKSFAASALEALVTKIDHESPTVTKSQELSKEDREGTTQLNTFQERDPKEITRYVNSLYDSLRDSIETKRLTVSLKDRKRLTHDIHTICKEIREQRRFSKSSIQADTNSENMKARRRIGKCIKYAINNLPSELSALKTHLNHSLNPDSPGDQHYRPLKEENYNWHF